MGRAAVAPAAAGREAEPHRTCRKAYLLGVKGRGMLGSRAVVQARVPEPGTAVQGSAGGNEGRSPYHTVRYYHN